MTVKGIRFYLEHDSPRAKRKGEHSGTVIAWDTDVLVGTLNSTREPIASAMVSVYAYPNSPVCVSGVAINYLSTHCKRISEARAREIHPALFERLDQ